MRKVFSAVVAVALAGLTAGPAGANEGPAGPVSSTGFEAVLSQAWQSLTASFAVFKGWDGEEEQPPRTTYIKVGKCWTRGANADADAMGLPKEFCVDTVGVEVHYPYYHPFTRGSVMLLEGKPVSGRLHISGGAREKTGWALVGSLFSGGKPEAEQACGTLNVAGAAIYVGTDLEGRLIPDAPVSVRGYLFDGASLCRTPAKSAEIQYSQKQP